MDDFGNLQDRSRSPYLRPFDRPPTPDRARRIRKRLTRAALILALPTILILLVAFRLPSRYSSLGNILYAAHDIVYLSLKGYLFTAGLPWTIALWSFCLIVVGLILISYFSDRSLLRGPHISLLRLVLRLAVRTPWLYELLVGTTGFLRKRGLGGDLLRIVASDERGRVIQLLSGESGVQSREADARYLARLSCLSIALRLLPPVGRSEHMAAASEWVETFLYLDLSGVLSQSDKPREVNPFLDTLGSVLKPLMHSDQEAGCFSSSAFSRDLIHLLCLASPRSPERPFESDSARALTDSERQKMRAKLTRSIGQRDDLLNQIRWWLEIWLTRGQSDLASRQLVELASQLPPSGEAEPVTLGRITVNLVLVLGAPTVSADKATLFSYLETIEALAFALDAAQPLTGVLGARDTFTRLYAMLAGLPLPEHYAICARAMASALEDRLSEWAPAAKTVLTVDRDHAVSLVDDLYRAAGPDFDPKAELTMEKPA